MKVGAGRDRIGAAGAAARLEGLLAGEDVPGRDQDLAGHGRLARVGLALAPATGPTSAPTANHALNRAISTSDHARATLNRPTPPSTHSLDDQSVD